MIAVLKRLFLYLYILWTKSKHRDTLVEILRRKSRPQRDIAFDKPGLPDVVDNVDEIPRGCHETHSLHGFDRHGTVIHYKKSKQDNEEGDITIHIPSVGTLVYYEDNTDDENAQDATTTYKKRLKVEVIDPMMKWRLAFRGHMNKVAAKGGGDDHVTCFVRFHLYWCSVGDPYDFWTDTPPWQLAGEASKVSISDALSLLNWNSIWFEQWGELRGTLCIDDEEFKLRIPSCRERRYTMGNAVDGRFCTIKSERIRVDATAHMYSYKAVEHRAGTVINFGHVLYPSLESYYTRKQRDPQFQITVCDRILSVEENGKQSIVSRADMEYHKYTLDGKSATCVSSIEKLTGADIVESARPNKTGDGNGVVNEHAVLVDLKYANCKRLVGGKAGNLFSLLSFGFNVPPGFCITIKAFQDALNEDTGVIDSIRKVESIIKENKLENLKAACENTVKCFKVMNFNADLRAGIETKLNTMESSDGKRVAVRSSAIGEDGEVLSAAGQLETILGVQGIDDVIEAVKQCWASYFSYQSVEYRRQNGQVIVDGMGVIVQEMVPSDVSGVMMTNDPMSGREDRIVINACFGLGESVVSGMTQSDSFLIGVEGDGGFHLLKEIIGKNKTTVDLLTSGDSRMNETTSSQTGPCLSIELINTLCSLGKSIERQFHLEQEIEWSIADGVIYILQTRPITSLDEETDDDLFHEFDSPVTGDSELITTCNIQEMMPGAATPLTTSYFVNGVTDGFLHAYTHVECGVKKVYHPSGFIVAHGNSFLMNVSPVYVLAANSVGGLKTKAFVEIDIIGEECKDVTVADIIDYKGSAFNSSWKIATNTFKNLFINNPRTNQEVQFWEKKLKTLTLVDTDDDIHSLYRRIDAHKMDLFVVWRLYFHMLSNVYVSIIKNILMGNSPDFTKENKEDMSNLLVKVGTISSEVPKAISKLASSITRSGLSVDFISQTENECLDLIKNNTELNKAYVDFMEKHGHRGIRESELMEKSWSQDPFKLIRSLKSILKNGSVERSEDAVDETKIADIMSNLQTAISPFNRWLIKKVLLRKALNKVLDRENGKSLAIKIIYVFKKAYWCLADRMVKESRIPDEQLLFFLTHREIGELIDTRSPRLIRKAKRRMKIYDRQQATRFERLSFGSPKILVESDGGCYTPLEASMVVEGLPIGNGEATGRACIVTQEDDVSLIKKGDIMICRYTDIGWSPYFPLLDGLVTEIGSMLSHGAVVARECGIPCIVNVANATKILKTGDIVRIHGNKGTVEKLS